MTVLDGNSLTLRTFQTRTKGAGFGLVELEGLDSGFLELTVTKSALHPFLPRNYALTNAKVLVYLLKRRDSASSTAIIYSTRGVFTRVLYVHRNHSKSK